MFFLSSLLVFTFETALKLFYSFLLVLVLILDPFLSSLILTLDSFSLRFFTLEVEKTLDSFTFDYFIWIFDYFTLILDCLTLILDYLTSIKFDCLAFTLDYLTFAPEEELTAELLRLVIEL